MNYIYDLRINSYYLCFLKKKCTVIDVHAKILKEERMKKIVCFHLYNDYSGSPKVLSMILEGLLKKGYNVRLHSSGKGGALDKLENIYGFKAYKHNYKFSEKKLVEIYRFIKIQFCIFFTSFRYIFDKDTVFYINTVLPVGAALAGWIMRKRIIYHYHENANAKGGIYRILATFMQYLANDIICVSKYQANLLKAKEKTAVVYNVLPLEFTEQFANQETYESFKRKRILMLSSLKLYKGVIEFIKLSKMLPEFMFTLVINDSEENIHDFLITHLIEIPDNITIYPRQTNVVQFYKNSSIVLNLTNKYKAVETFGLTVLEAFTAGLPVIVPTVGGIAELVDENINGYRIDVQDINKIKCKINEILSNEEIYKNLGKNAFEKSHLFNYSRMIENIEHIIRNE